MRKSLNVKDLIDVGIYTALYLVVYFVIGMANAIPILYPISYFYIPIFTGIPFMLFATKANKFGMITIMSFILGLFWYFMGYTWLPLVVYPACGLLADIIMKSGDYKSFKKTVIGFWLFSAGAIGLQMPMWIMTDTYMKNIRKQMGNEYTDKLIKYMPWWIGLVAVAILLVGSILGALLGRKMLKKHFEKAGIV